MPSIQTRLAPPRSERARKARRHSLAFIHEACDLADRIGTGLAARDMRIPRRLLSKWMVARRRARMSLDEACAAMMNNKLRATGSMAGPRTQAMVARQQSNLRLCTEVAKEAYSIARRMQVSLSACISQVSAKRGVNPETVLTMVRGGAIPEHWLQ